MSEEKCPACGEDFLNCECDDMWVLYTDEDDDTEDDSRYDFDEETADDVLAIAAVRGEPGRAYGLLFSN